MTSVTYKILGRFDKQKHHVKVTPSIEKCLKLFQEGQTFRPTEFIAYNHGRFTKPNTSIHNTAKIFWQSVKIAEGLGIIEKINDRPLTIHEFMNLHTVRWWLDQLPRSKFKNIKPSGRGFGLSATQHGYLYNLYGFNNWLHGKSFPFTRFIPQGPNVVKKVTGLVKLEGIEHFLNLYKESSNGHGEYVKVIKQYLLDPVHQEYNNGKGKKAVTIERIDSAIRSYFKHNEAEISYLFNAKSRYDTENSGNLKLLTLQDIVDLLTVGRPSILEKAVFLCKFQRGLDTSTLVDRFNFEAWPQLVRYFKTPLHNMWDLDMCPVPIVLTRIKTGVKHLGFIDRDAVTALQKYLDSRYEITGKPLDDSSPIFLSPRKLPINGRWVANSFKRLAENSGLRKKIDLFEYAVDSHEMRDTLKSTLKSCGADAIVADSMIGHKGEKEDSYDKQDRLYIEKYVETKRIEYAKASKMINIFTKVGTALSGESTQLFKMSDELETVKHDNLKLHDAVQRLQDSISITNENKEILIRELLSSPAISELIKSSLIKKINEIKERY